MGEEMAGNMNSGRRESLDKVIDRRIRAMLGEDFDELEPGAKLDAVKTSISWWKAQQVAKEGEFGAGLSGLLTETVKDQGESDE